MDDLGIYIPISARNMWKNHGDEMFDFSEWLRIGFCEVFMMKFGVSEVSEVFLVARDFLKTDPGMITFPFGNDQKFR